MVAPPATAWVFLISNPPMLKVPDRMSLLSFIGPLLVVFWGALVFVDFVALLGLGFEAFLAAFTISLGGRTGFLSITGRGLSTGLSFGIGRGRIRGLIG